MAVVVDETCSKCHRKIPPSEPVHLVGTNMVCGKCLPLSQVANAAARAADHGTPSPPAARRGLFKELFDRSLTRDLALSPARQKELRVAEGAMAIWWLKAFQAAGATLIGLSSILWMTPGLSTFLPMTQYFLIEGALQAGMAFGMYRRSRACFVLAVCYGSFALVGKMANRSPSVGLQFVFLMVFSIAAFQAFKYHRIVGDAYRRLPRPVLVGTIIAFVAATLCAFAIAVVSHRDGDKAAPSQSSTARPTPANQQRPSGPVVQQYQAPPTLASSPPAPLRSRPLTDQELQRAVRERFGSQPASAPIPAAPMLPAPVDDLTRQVRERFGAQDARPLPGGVPQLTTLEMMEIESRVDAAQRLKKKGVEVDYTKYTTLEMMEMESKVDAAQRLRDKGVEVINGK